MQTIAAAWGRSSSVQFCSKRPGGRTREMPCIPFTQVHTLHKIQQWGQRGTFCTCSSSALRQQNGAVVKQVRDLYRTQTGWDLCAGRAACARGRRCPASGTAEQRWELRHRSLLRGRGESCLLRLYAPVCRTRAFFSAVFLPGEDEKMFCW